MPTRISSATTLVLRTVPIQSAATLGRADFGVDDIEMLLHFPPIKVYGCYFDNITKEFKDGRVPPVVKLTYNGVSKSAEGVVKGRVNNHLKYLHQNYQYLPESKKEGCADVRPKAWDENRSGTWVTKWDCQWDFRASGISYCNDIRQLTIAVKTAKVSGMVHDCSNCGLICNGANKGRMRQISKADAKIRCHNCNTWSWRKVQISEHPWH